MLLKNYLAQSGGKEEDRTGEQEDMLQSLMSGKKSA